MYKKAITAIMTITLASFLFYSTPVFADHNYVTTTISKVMPAVVEVSAESFSKNTLGKNEKKKFFFTIIINVMLIMVFMD